MKQLRTSKLTPKTCLSASLTLSLITLFGMPANTFAQRQVPLPRNFRQQQNTPQQESPNEKLRQTGFDHYQKGEYQQAINIATQVLQSEPKDPIAFYLRASARIELGRQTGNRLMIRDGIQDSREALGIRGADDKFANLYIPYLYGMSSLAVVERKESHAEMAVKTAGPIIDKESVSHADKANLLYQRALARQQLMAVAAANFAQQDANDEQREVFEAAQAARQKAAIEDYALAIRFNPKQMGAHINMAKALVAAGETDRAEQAFAAAIQEFPRNATIFNERGVFFRQQKRTDEAIADFTRAVEIQKNFVMGYINRGFCLSDKGEDEAAEADFATAATLSPSMSLIYNLRGTARMSLGRLQPAIADFTKQIQLNAQDGDAYGNRGFALFFAGEYAKAAQDFQNALKLSPTAYHLAAWRFLARQRAGQGDAAKTELEGVLNAPNGPKGWVSHLGRFLLQQITADQLIASTQEVKNPETAKAQRCEAEFFIGQQNLIEGNSDAAKARFEAAIDTGVRYLSAYRGSRYELGEFSTN